MNEHADPKTAITVSIAEAKMHFSELLARAAAGQTVHVTKHGRPYAKIGAESAPRPKRRFGAFKATEFWMAEDFDELGPEWSEYVG